MEFNMENFADSYINEHHDNLSDGVKAKIKKAFVDGAYKFEELLALKFDNMKKSLDIYNSMNKKKK